jgi:hypothetical protein
MTVTIDWHASGGESLLPSFNGELALTDTADGTSVELTGTYTLCVGSAPRWGDTVLERRHARRSLRAFVERLASHLQATFDQRAESPPPAVEDPTHPEIYVG